MGQDGARSGRGLWWLLTLAVMPTGGYVASGFWYVGWSSIMERGYWEPRSAGLLWGALEHTTDPALWRWAQGWHAMRTERVDWCVLPIHTGTYWLVPLWPLPACAWLAVAWPVWRRGLRRRCGQCISCGYQRRGLAADTACPECGAVRGT